RPPLPTPAPQPQPLTPACSPPPEGPSDDHTDPDGAARCPPAPRCRRGCVHRPQPAPQRAQRRRHADGDPAAGDADAAVRLRVRRCVRPERRLRELRGARHHPALRRVRGRIDGRGRGRGQGRRDHGPAAHPADPQLGGGDRARGGQPGPEPAGHCGVIAVAFAIGFRPTGGPIQWLLALGLVALYILAITYLFAAIGLATGSPEAANGYGFVLLFLPYLSTAFVGADTLPTWLRGFAEHQPITP